MSRGDVIKPIVQRQVDELRQLVGDRLGLRLRLCFGPRLRSHVLTLVYEVSVCPTCSSNMQVTYT
jgi:hypothetical protein